LPTPDKTKKTIVTNTSPLIALVAAWGTLDPLKDMYHSVKVPKEVSDEILQGGANNFAVTEFEMADFLEVAKEPVNLSRYLSNSLDRGEAAVIQLALDQNIETVCIDETIGRRIARMSGLSLTGSIGVLARYKSEFDLGFSLVKAIGNMQRRGIRMGNKIMQFAREQDEQNT